MADQEQYVTDRILGYLRASALGGDPGGELTDATPLFEYGLLNSIRTAELVAFIRDDLGVDVSGLDLTSAAIATTRDLAKAVTSLGRRSGERPGRQ
jgi:acyl carrier protein